MVVDGEEINLTPGDTVCIARRTIHTFSADAGNVAFLAVTTPGLCGPPASKSSRA